MIDINILDLVMYIIFLGIIIWILGDEYTTELGGLLGLVVIMVYTAIYIVFFVLIDYNWIDLIHNWSVTWKISL